MNKKRLINLNKRKMSNDRNIDKYLGYKIIGIFLEISIIRAIRN